MIQYIKRKNLNVEKYDACIENSVQSRIYAFSWYLDIVADNWDVLVLNDYEAVMPIPWKQKYFIKYIAQPFFCQQLGVFSKEDTSESLVRKIIFSIPSKFLKFYYQFNSNNEIGTKGIRRDNYILELQNDYSKLRSNYRKDRKDRIKQVKKKDYLLVPTTAIELIKISKEYYNFLNITNKEFLKLEVLINASLERGEGFILGALNNKGEILGSCFFLKSKNRIFYLYSAVTEEGRKNQVASLIIDNVIENYANKNYILDFEGSVIPGIASFFKSFGAKLEEYTSLEYYKFSFLLRLFKK